MGLQATPKRGYSHNDKTETKNLAKYPEENNGIASEEEFENEYEFRDWLADWLQGKSLYRSGRKNERGVEDWDKKEKAAITKIEKEPSTSSGNGDIAIHHDDLNLSWNHILASPFILELKRDEFRYAAAQAIRYKKRSSQKYEEKGDYKILKTGIATPQSLSTGEIAKRWGKDKTQFYANKQAKRIYWQIGVGVAQSINQKQIILSFNEGDMVKIK